MADRETLVERLLHLISLNEPEKGGPYGGFAAAQCMEAMREAARDLTRLKAKVEELEGVLARGMPFGYDPATGFFHEDDGGAPASCVHYVPAFEVADLSARLARAVEVMRPFTCVVDLPDGHVQWTPPSLPAFQAARAFLSEQENPHG